MRQTNYFQDLIANYIMGKSAAPAMSDVWLTFFTADPTVAGSLTNEIAGGSFARVALKTLMGTSAGGVAVNTSQVATPTATAGWGNVTYVGLMDSSGLGTGNLLMFKALGSGSKVINTGGRFVYEVGDFSLRLPLS